MNPTEAEDIKKRWQEDTEEQYRKDLHDQDNHNGVITHLEPDMEKQTGSKLGREYINTAYCRSAYLTYMRCTPFKISGWINHKQEPRLWEKYE